MRQTSCYKIHHRLIEALHMHAEGGQHRVLNSVLFSALAFQTGNNMFSDKQVQRVSIAERLRRRWLSCNAVTQS